MIIPDDARRNLMSIAAGGLATLAKPGKGGSGIIKEWSSFIGIITAIIGNILISIALNTQRYAHLHLDREHREKRRRRARAEQQGQENHDAVNGAQELPSGLEREGKLKKRHTDPANRLAESPDYARDAPRETDPLLPRDSQANGQHELDDLPKKEREGSDDEQKSYLKSPLWWLGLILMIVGEAGNFLAYGFAPASIVSPLGVVALISNCIIAPFMLKEKFRMRDFFGVIIAIGGAVTVVVSAKQSNPKLGPKQIWRLIATWEFETYLGLTTAAIIALAIASDKYGDRSVLIDLGLVALFGGYTALSTKGVASMLSYTLFRALTFPMTYLLVVVLVSTAVMQIRYLNRALQRFDSTVVIPTQFVLFTLSVILGSAVLYRDFERTEAANAGEFIGGCALTFAGVWLITSGRRSSSDDDDFEYDEDAEAEPDTIDMIDEEQQSIGEASAVGSHHQQTRDHAAIPVRVRRASSSLSQPKFSASPQTPHTSTFHPPPETPTTPGSGTDYMTEPSSLADNPWLGPASASPFRRDDIRQPLLASYSEPVLPAEAQVGSSGRLHFSRTPEPLPSAAAHSHGGSGHPPSSSAAAHSHATPTAPRTNPSANPFRNSLTELVPGPLLTPLSGSLSAVVADTLRRGVDASSLKRRRSIARGRLPDSPRVQRARGASEADVEAAAALAFGGASRHRGGSGGADEIDDPPPGAADGASPSPSARSAKKGKPLNQTLRGLFKRDKKKKGDPASVEEEAAAGSPGGEPSSS